VVNNQRLTT